MKNKAFSIIEVAISLCVGGIAVYLLSSAFKGLFSRTQVQKLQGEADIALLQANQMIGNIGRVARVCLKQSSDELRCQIDFTRPATGMSLSSVRFIKVGSELLYQVDESATNAGIGSFTGTVTTKMTYPNIESFEICDDSDMGLGGTLVSCSIDPIEISRIHGLNPTASVEDPSVIIQRFFRYRLTSKRDDLNGQNASSSTAFSRRVQGAFYVRNPVDWVLTGAGSPILNKFYYSW